MPTTPTSWRAFFTESSKCGRITLSTFFKAPPPCWPRWRWRLTPGPDGGQGLFARAQRDERGHEIGGRYRLGKVGVVSRRQRPAALGLPGVGGEENGLERVRRSA